MKNSLTGNWILKLASLIVAAVVWLGIVNIDDPVITRTIDGIQVDIVNGSYIEELGKSYSILADADQIAVSVTGKRSVIDSLAKDDFIASADLTQIVSLETNPCMVPISVICSEDHVNSVQPKKQALALNIEKMTSADFIISASRGDTEPKTGYEVGKLSVEPEKVTITGPESLINRIDKVVAGVDVSDMTEDKLVDAQLKIIDKNQDTMSDSKTQYLKYSIGDNHVSVRVTIWKVVDGIGLLASYTGSPASGYQVAEVTTTPSTISLAASEETLAKLQEEGNIIEIPKRVMDVGGESADKEITVDITDYLPKEAILPKDVSSSVIIKADILPEGSKEFSVETSNITVNNKPDGYRVSFNSDKISVRIKGLESELENLSKEQIQASIDLGQKNDLAQTLQVSINLPAGYQLVEPVSVSLTLEKTVDSSS
ncbi:MAG TPA: CdaR family protein [Lachnospiraceae bacterium]